MVVATGGTTALGMWERPRGWDLVETRTFSGGQRAAMLISCTELCSGVHLFDVL